MLIFKKIENLYQSFLGKKGVIGKSYKGAPIYWFGVKKTERPKLIFTYGIHAREHITCHLALKQIEDFFRFGKYGTVYFIPMLNPDGVKIARTEKPLYKANARGVDLNVNFDARWGTGKSNVFYRADSNYVGKHPFSEPETQAIRDFTLKIMPDMTVSYHCKGEEIYWEFHQDASRRERDYQLAKVFSLATGYPLVSVVGSAGGYKDWCIEKLKIPAVTIEVGSDSLSHPIEIDRLEDIYERNKNVVFDVSEKLYERIYE